MHRLDVASDKRDRHRQNRSASVAPITSGTSPPADEIGDRGDQHRLHGKWRRTVEGEQISGDTRLSITARTLLRNLRSNAALSGRTLRV